MHCRMCSQRMTGPGRLCRECERELDRARAASASVGDLSSAAPLVDAARMSAGDPPGLAERLPSRGTLLVAAFSVGLALAVSFYAARGSHPRAAAESVMIGRDLSNVRPREIRAPASATPRAGDAPAAASAPVAHRNGGYDRVLGLADALDTCASETPYARVACEQRARARYCAASGAERIPQCAEGSDAHVRRQQR